MNQFFKLTTFLLISLSLLLGCSCNKDRQGKETTDQSKNETITEFPKTMYANAKAGLRMRSEPSLESKRIGSYPYGEQIQVLERSSTTTTIDGVTAHWYKTKVDITFEKVNYKYAWVFGGFLSESSPTAAASTKDDSMITCCTICSAPPSKVDREGVICTVSTTCYGDSTQECIYPNANLQQVYNILKGKFSELKDTLPVSDIEYQFDPVYNDGVISYYASSHTYKYKSKKHLHIWMGSNESGGGTIIEIIEQKNETRAIITAVVP